MAVSSFSIFYEIASVVTLPGNDIVIQSPMGEENDGGLWIINISLPLAGESTTAQSQR